jgi:hypothetical protein
MADIVKAFSRRSLFITVVFMGLGTIFFGTVSYFVLKLSAAQLSLWSQTEGGVPAIKQIMAQIVVNPEQIIYYAVAICAIIFFLFGIIFWLFLRGSFKTLLKDRHLSDTAKPAQVAEKSTSQKEEQEQNNRRLFLYLLSLLQRDGRLLDFLSEDLERFEDSQIGAAVRNIHENCKKVIDKNLAPRAVIDSNEGEEISVEQGFNPNEIKLIGNVTGEPPFKGILRHKGWQTKKINLPTLTSGQDAGIIAPAEVEIR